MSAAGYRVTIFPPRRIEETVDTPNDPPEPTAAETTKVTRHHQVEFYSDETEFVVGFTHFIENALAAGTAVISVVTKSHQESLLQSLREHGVDMVAAIDQGRYVALDVGDMLSTFMVKDLPDAEQFLKIASHQIAAAERASTGNQPRVALCGECAPVLWEQGKTDAAMEVEHLCEKIARSCDTDVLCGYVLSAFQSEQETQIYHKNPREALRRFFRLNCRSGCASSQPREWNRVQGARAR